MKGLGQGGRLPGIDALKALASQSIVLHHLAFYGPMSDHTHRLWPELVAWFSQDARMAVQVFLVISGFLAASALAPQGSFRLQSGWAALAAWGKRYVSVALPYVAALAVAVVCNAWARAGMVHSSIPEPVTLEQFVAHALLLHGLLGVDSLSAGVWYVAIDLQLFGLLLALLWLGQRLGRRLAGGFGRDDRHGLGPALVLGMGLASAFHFNTVPEWDVWALYFFAAFSAGCWAWWSSTPGAPLALRVYALVGLGGLILALELDFRERLVVALATAALLWAARVWGWLGTWPRSRVLAYLGRISYGVFLMNFPVALLVNAAFTRWAPPDPVVQTVGVALAWLACVLAGAAFHHAVESPMRRWPSKIQGAWLRLATVLTRRA